MMPRNRMEPPCMSCGSSKFEPPPVGCLDTRSHYTPEKHQVWALMHYPDGDRYEIRGTGVIL